ncbi:hypothetical protein G6011_07939 [Alternaria panax]|uniref:Uncharacterized protein n=1 Tax=Alternaria panax TaxID=48097 RepID=A0AAD4F8R2_9PLEO|nr:hypothetical protein G6011_07939 [Alternaria panax]
MDIISKKDVLALDSLPDQRTRIFAIKQSAATVQESTIPLRGWVCHNCAHFNTSSTLASLNGPCRTCHTPACDAECADAIVAPRDDPHSSGYACWYCKYFWVWSEHEDGQPVQDKVLSCRFCGELEEEEVVFIKSWFEEVGKKERERKEPEQKPEQEKSLIDQGTKDGKSEEREVDNGEGAFTVVDRKRAKPKKKKKKKVENEEVNDGDDGLTKVDRKRAKPKKKIPDNLLANNGIPEYAFRKPGRPTR